MRLLALSEEESASIRVELLQLLTKFVDLLLQVVDFVAERTCLVLLLEVFFELQHLLECFTLFLVDHLGLVEDFVDIDCHLFHIGVVRLLQVGLDHVEVDDFTLPNAFPILPRYYLLERFCVLVLH